MTLVDAMGNPIATGRAITEKYQPGPRFLWGQQPRDLPLFSFEMVQYMLLDQTIKLGLAMRAAPIYAAEFGYEDEGGQWVQGVRADREDVAKFVESQLRKIWDFHIDKLMKAQVWGWAGGEVTYKTEDVPGTGRKRIVIDDILDTHAADCRALVRNGKLAGVRVHGCDKDLSVPGTGYWHPFSPDPRSFYGRGVLIGAYSAWADKWLDGGALDVRRVFMHTDAYGGMRIGYPPGSIDIDGKGEDIPNRDVAREIVEQYRSGNVQVFPNVYDERGNKLWTVEDGRVANNPGHILQYPKDLDVEMLRGMEIPDDVLTSEATGSWQGKQVPMQAFYQGLNGWLFQLVETVVVQILEPLVLWNFGRPEDFHVEAKRLDKQVMEQQQGGQEQQPPGQEGGADGGLGGLLGGMGGDDTGEADVPGIGSSMQPGSQFMSLDPVEAVGAGVLKATHLVKAARRLLDERDPFVVAEQNRAYDNERAADNQDDYACVMLMLPADVASQVRELGQQIALEDLTEKGLEHEPHITVKFGVIPDEAEQIRHVLKAFGPVAVRIGKTSVFENQDCDVVKLEVESYGLHELNGQIAQTCACNDTHPVYVPHITIAYVKPGRGRKYVGIEDLAGTSVAFDELVFSDRSRNKFFITLNGPVRFNLDDSDDEPQRMSFDESKVKRDAGGQFSSTGSNGSKSGTGAQTPKSQRRQRADDAITQASAALTKGSVPKAKRLIERAAKFGATDEELEPLRDQLAGNSTNKATADAKQRQIESAASAARSAAPKPKKTDPLVSALKTDPAKVMKGSKVEFKYTGSHNSPPQSKVSLRQVDPGGKREAKVKKLWRPKLNNSEHVQALVSFKEPIEVSQDGKTWTREDKRVSVVVDIIGDKVVQADHDYRRDGAQVLTDYPGLKKKPQNLAQSRVPTSTALLAVEQLKDHVSQNPTGDDAPSTDKIDEDGENDKRTNDEDSCDPDVDADVKLLARAPTGGVTVGGQFYPGGRFIPGEAMAQATAEEKAAIAGTGPSARKAAPRKLKAKPGHLQVVARDKKGRIVPPRGQTLPAHLQKLRIPPAWEKVQVDFHAKADLIATGVDSKGRKQSVYSDSYQVRQAAAKFKRIRELKTKRAQVEKTVDKHIKSKDHKTRDAATVMKLIMATGLRPGSSKDTKASVQAYGATTLQSRHVIVKGKQVTLQFTGKKGVKRTVMVTDPGLAKMLQKRKRATSNGAQRLFSVSDNDLRAYATAVAGPGFHPKDFRTLKGTDTASRIVAADNECCKDAKSYKKRVREVATTVASVLGNTPTVALQSYIDPTVFAKWRPANA